MSRGTVLIYENFSNTQKCIEPKSQYGVVCSVCISDDGIILTIGYEQGVIGIFNLQTFSFISNFSEIH